MGHRIASRRIRHGSLPGALLVLSACNSSPMLETQEDPALVEAARAEEARAAELEQAVLAIESAAPHPLDEGQFYQLLDYYCGDCHFPVDYPSEAQLSYFNDLDLLISKHKVIPGDAEGSLLVLRMRRDQVPPPEWQQPPVTDVAIELVADFIDRLPVNSEDPPSP